MRDAQDAVRSPRTDADWKALVEEFGGTSSNPLRVTLDTVRGNGCQTVIVERDYVCQDFRSEYVAHWAHRHQAGEPFATRLHFFADEIAFEDLHRLSTELDYLGYTVIRPIAHGPLGRTVIRPPAELANARLTTVVDEVALFGTPFLVEGVPFAQQDGEFVRCAHAAAWICNYVGHLRGLGRRRRMAEFIHAPPDFVSAERPLPSQGLSAVQLQALFGSFGQPAQFYPIGRLLPTVIGVDKETEQGPACDLLPRGLWPDGRIVSVACRYLNAGFPVLVGSEGHAFVLVGWFKKDGAVQFVACDDQQGPYEVIEDIAADRRAPWKSLMVPLPPKVWLTAEAVELDACLSMLLGRAKPAENPALFGLGESFDHLSIRTTLMRGSAYKQSLLSQSDRPEDAVREIRLSSLPYWVWVVEAQLREARAQGKPCVVGEFVYDPTSSRSNARKLSLAAPHYTIVYGSRPDDPVILHEDEIAVWSSHFEPVL